MTGVERIAVAIEERVEVDILFLQIAFCKKC